MQTLTHEQIRSKAPSVFCDVPATSLSEKYRFIPTSEVLEGMEEAGFNPVMASQTTARHSNRRYTNRHLLRFRHDDIKPTKDGEIPEVCLYNSHNGTCSYRLMFGIFRMVCSNGLIVMSDSIGEVKVRHIGNVVDNVIEESVAVLQKAPEVFNQITDWKNISLDEDEQTAFGLLARAARPGAIDLEPMDLIEARRVQDDVEKDGSRSLWKTMNVVQENIIRGGLTYKDANASSRLARGVNAIHADELVNRKLWEITEEFATDQLIGA